MTELPVPQATPVAAPASTPAPAPQEAALPRDEVREVQARLLAFGFNPGPVDGDLGRRTQGAVMRYQQERGRVQTGTVDHDLLEQLRQDPAPKDPAPQVAAARPAAPREPPRAVAQRRSHSDPLEFLRSADANLTQWFQSLGRR